MEIENVQKEISKSEWSNPVARQQLLEELRLQQINLKAKGTDCVRQSITVCGDDAVVVFDIVVIT